MKPVRNRRWGQQISGAPGDNGALRCPHFAHVRKVNLRDKLTDQGPSFRFRILRRGIPYGAPWTDGEAEAPDRGLLFLSYQRDLQAFMTLSSAWMNRPGAPEQAGHDFLVGQNASGARTSHNEKPVSS
jgi:deferrochelatase/peroxidase EfeB